MLIQQKNPQEISCTNFKQWQKTFHPNFPQSLFWPDRRWEVLVRVQKKTEIKHRVKVDIFNGNFGLILVGC